MMPSQKYIEVPLLEALVEIGERGKPRDIYPLVTKRFPEITKEELAMTHKTGANKWTNRIQFVRQALVSKGEIDGSKIGIWAITDMGRERLKRPPLPIEEPKDKRHAVAVEQWSESELAKLGTLRDVKISTKNVNLNTVLPKNIKLEKNIKFLDGLATLESMGLISYRRVLEVQDKGQMELLCVKVSIALPYVTGVDIVSDDSSLDQIEEFLNRLCNPNLVKSRVSFHSFKSFLKR